MVCLRTRINTLPDGPYLELMGRLIRQAVVTGDEEVVVGKMKRESARISSNKSIRNWGRAFRATFGWAPDRADIDGGFICGGKVQVNCSTAVLMY